MKKFFKKIIKRIKGASHQESFDGYTHIINETYPGEEAHIPCWNNVHGYGKDSDFFACVDMRVMGFRVQNLIVRCSNENDMRSWCESMSSNKCIDRIKSIPHQTGEEMDMCYTFNTTDGDSKDYNITWSTDFYADVR